MTRPVRALRAMRQISQATQVLRSTNQLLRQATPLRRVPQISALPSTPLNPSTAPTAGPSRLRHLSTTPVLAHGDIVRPKPGTGIKVTYQDPKGKVIKTIEGNAGDDLLSLAHDHDIDLEGACERSVACSTCHVIVAPEYYDKLPDPEDDENDMLDLAFGLEDTSRLGCQVILTKELDGIVVKLPSATRNMYVDGAKARTH